MYLGECHKTQNGNHFHGKKPAEFFFYSIIFHTDHNKYTKLIHITSAHTHTRGTCLQYNTYLRSAFFISTSILNLSWRRHRSSASKFVISSLMACRIRSPSYKSLEIISAIKKNAFFPETLVPKLFICKLAVRSLAVASQTRQL